MGQEESRCCLLGPLCLLHSCSSCGTAGSPSHPPTFFLKKLFVINLAVLGLHLQGEGFGRRQLQWLRLLEKCRALNSYSAWAYLLLAYGIFLDQESILCLLHCIPSAWGNLRPPTPAPPPHLLTGHQESMDKELKEQQGR